MPDKRIANIKIGKRHRKQLGKLDRLKASIEEIGLLHPIVVRPDGKLVAGRRRLEAFKQLGRKMIPAHVVDVEAIVRGECDENTLREDFTPSECVDIAADVEAEEKRLAKKRQQEHGKTAPGKKADTSANFAEVKGETRAKVAGHVGMSHTTLTRATEVVAAAKADPEKYGKLAEDMDRTGKVAGVHKQLKKQQQAEEIRQEPPPLPEGPFRVIIADPPWAYEKRVADPSHRTALPYSEMDVQAICEYHKAWPKGFVHKQGAILWLWTTNAHMRQAYDVVDAWGFKPKTILTWFKHKMGTGDWLRGQTEHCIMAIRGKPTVTLTNQTTAIEGKVRQHSRKPEEFYALVESLCPGAIAELFGRTKRKRITVCGHESGRFQG
jgi:N6-adenosine-specific RNA methylase IME4/ParB-like chromosome segregation protein Spo0J